MNNKAYTLIICLTAALLIAIFVIIMLIKENRILKRNLPYLLNGESVEYFSVRGIDDKKIDASYLKQKLSLIYIFKQPCNRCNDNVFLWKKIAKLVMGEANIYGIILNGYTELVNFSKSGGLNFKLYTPEDPIAFKKAFRIRRNYPQTIVIQDGKVLYSNIGELSGDDYTHVLSLIKGNKRQENGT